MPTMSIMSIMSHVPWMQSMWSIVLLYLLYFSVLAAPGEQSPKDSQAHATLVGVKCRHQMLDGSPLPMTLVAPAQPPHGPDLS